jgi:hypothetical protein
MLFKKKNPLKISEEEKFDTKLTLPLAVRRRTPFFMLYRE